MDSLASYIIGLVIVWASELQAFAISLVAVAAAFVIATKELIMCIMGGLLKATSKPFRLGDRIEINGLRGDVVDHNMLTTTLDEIGPGKLTHQYTGKRVTLPNSLFLSQPIVNEVVTRKYAIHTFTVPTSPTTKIITTKSKLLKSSEKICSNYIDYAKNYMERLERSSDIELPNVSPRVTISIPDEKRVDLIVRVPVPTKRAGKIEQEILEDFFSTQK